MLFTFSGSAKDDRGEARSKPSGVDGEACDALSFQRWHRRAHAQADPTGPAGHNRAVAIIDDDRPEIGTEVHLLAVLRENRRQLYRRRVERGRPATPRLVSQPSRQTRGGITGRQREV